MFCLLFLDVMIKCKLVGEVDTFDHLHDDVSDCPLDDHDTVNSSKVRMI